MSTKIAISIYVEFVNFDVRFFDPTKPYVTLLYLGRKLFSRIGHLCRQELIRQY
jgi:hypothetical protein